MILASATWLVLAAIGGFIAVAAGAGGAHSLGTGIDGHRIALFETGVRYQMYHALALVAVAWLADRAPPRAARPVALAGWGFVAGSVAFCFSLYFQGVTGSRALTPLTPVGGSLFLIGWLCLAAAALRMRSGKG